MDTAFVCTPEEVLEHFNVTEKDGLNDGAVEAARAKYGRNGISRMHACMQNDSHADHS